MPSKISAVCSMPATPVALSQKASRLTVGVNTARTEAYRHVLVRGFRADFYGVVMERPNEAGYNRPGVYLIDDLR
jgi:hypothetical protein